jgi:hypothetical protein
MKSLIIMTITNVINKLSDNKWNYLNQQSTTAEAHNLVKKKI